VQPKEAKQRIRKVIHPNSRTAKQMGRANHRSQTKVDKMNDKALKLNKIATKLQWFQNNLDQSVDCYSQQALTVLVER